jgi:hypothetical protein
MKAHGGVTNRLKKLICLARAAPIAFARNAVGYPGDIFIHRDLRCGLRVATGATDRFVGRAGPGEDCAHPRERRGHWVRSTLRSMARMSSILMRDRVTTGGVPPGHITLIASLSWDIGQYKYEFNAVAGKTYAFELSRRGEHLAAGILFGLSGPCRRDHRQRRAIGRVQDHTGSVRLDQCKPGPYSRSPCAVKNFSP